jgi:Mg2+-importing ATPase
VLFLPFLPMLPLQIILNNFIYDFSQITIPTDNIDAEFVKKPKRWNMSFIKKFMLYLGPVSSVFDITTYIILFSVLKVHEAAFQTGWFLESFATQTLVIHIIRTKKLPFFQSNASRWLFISNIACVIFAWVLPYTKLGAFFKFAKLPVSTLLIIGGIVIAYLICMEIGKRIFYKYNDF